MKISMKPQELDFNLATAQFIKHCKVKNLSEKTISNYVNRGEKFHKFIGDMALEDISKRTIEDYIYSIKDTVKPRTINSDLSAIRTLLYYFMDEGYVPHFKIELMKIDKEVKETYSQKELEKLLKKPNLRKCDFTEYKIWVLENYLLGTGNRLGTVLNIKIEDLDFDNDCVLLRKTKSRKQQIIPLTHSLIVILREYLRYRGGAPEDYLFCSSTGLKADTRTIQQQVARYNQKRGVNKTSCHLFRHTFAKMFILNGGDAFRLQKLLGHSTLHITLNYVNMFADELSIGYENFNPLEQFAKRETIKM